MRICGPGMGGAMTVRVADAARYLCEKSGWKLSNLALQKILYVADMNFAGIGRGRLVDEDFEAWDYGPVIPSLYHQCKAFGSGRIPDIFWDARSIDGTPEAQVLDVAWERLGHQSAARLVENTHWAEGAWAKLYAPGARGRKITLEDMIDEHRNRTRRASTGSGS